MNLSIQYINQRHALLEAETSYVLIRRSISISLNSLCKKVRDARKESKCSCIFYKNTGESVIPKDIKWDISDIEDLHRIGK